MWVTGNYDPETNLAYLGHRQRRSVDGRPAARRQPLHRVDGRHRRRHRRDQGPLPIHPNESWDWDEVSPPILVDYQRNGRTVKGLIDVARNGYLWFLERTNGPIKFVEGKPYVKQNVFRGLDPKTGRPDVDPARQAGTGKRADFCPSHWGGKNWPPIAYSPQTRMIYVPANENLCASMIGKPVRTSPAALHRRDEHADDRARAPITSAKCRRGTSTPARALDHTFAKSPNWGPMLATGGGLVFSGGTNDRMFRAFDATTGKRAVAVPNAVRRHRPVCGRGGGRGGGGGGGAGGGGGGAGEGGGGGGQTGRAGGGGGGGWG